MERWIIRMKNEASLKDNKNFKIVFIIILTALFFVAFILGNTKGTLEVGVKNIFEVIMNDDGSPERMVIWNIRLPRMILAALVGTNLALAGAILQGVMNNPLADPSIIGIKIGRAHV